MRRRVLLFLAALVFTVAARRFIDESERKPPLMIGIPIPALRQAVGDGYEIGKTDAVSDSPFQAVFDRVIHQKTKIAVSGGVLIQEAVGGGNDSLPDYILYTFIPDEASAYDLSFSEEFSPYYDVSELENGATVYKRSGRSVMPTTEFTYIKGEKLQTVYSVCDFVVCSGENAVSWAVYNPELTDDEALMIADYLRN